MRPQSIAVTPVAPDNLAFNAGTNTLSWTDNSIADTAYVVQKMVGGALPWVDLDTISTLDLIVFPVAPNTTGAMSYVDATYAADDVYRVVAQNTVGDTTDYSNPGNKILPGTFAFPVVTAESTSATLTP